MSEEARLLLETLSDLRVVDLKRELEKRKLSKSGSKKELCERLRSVSDESRQILISLNYLIAQFIVDTRLICYWLCCNRHLDLL